MREEYRTSTCTSRSLDDGPCFGEDQNTRAPKRTRYGSLAPKALLWGSNHARSSTLG